MIWFNGEWAVHRIDEDGLIAESDYSPSEESGRIIRWAELPFETEKCEYTTLHDDEADEAIKKMWGFSFDSSGTVKYIPDHMDKM